MRSMSSIAEQRCAAICNQVLWCPRERSHNKDFSIAYRAPPLSNVPLDLIAYFQICRTDLPPQRKSALTPKRE
jgi:hypothetical protein